MNLYPDSRVRVKQWVQVMMGFVELRRILRPAPVTQVEQARLDDRCTGGFRQDVDVAHESQVRLGIDLLANGDAFEEREGRGSSFAGPDDLVRGVQPFAGHHPGGQVGALYERPERRLPRVQIASRRASKQWAQARVDGPADMVATQVPESQVGAVFHSGPEQELQRRRGQNASLPVVIDTTLFILGYVRELSQAAV